MVEWLQQAQGEDPRAEANLMESHVSGSTRVERVDLASSWRQPRGCFRVYLIPPLIVHFSPLLQADEDTEGPVKPAAPEERPSLVESDREGGLLGIPLFKPVKVMRDEGDDAVESEEDWGRTWTQMKIGRDTQEILDDHGHAAVGNKQGGRRGYARQETEEDEEDEELVYEVEEDDEEGGERQGKSVVDKMHAAVAKLGVVGNLSRGRRASTSMVITSSMLRKQLEHQMGGGGGGMAKSDTGDEDQNNEAGEGSVRGGDREGSAHGSRRRRSSAAAAAQEDQEEVDDEALNGSFSDFKRGKRFRKLTKMLGSVQVGDDHQGAF